MPWRHHRSLTRRAAGALLLFALLPALVLGLALSAWYQHQQAQAAEALLANMADGSELALRGYLARHRDAVATLARNPVLAADFVPSIAAPRLHLLQQMYPGFLTTFAATPDGAVIWAEPARDASGNSHYWQGVSMAERPFFHRALRSGKVVVSGLFLSRGRGQGMVVAVAAPVRAADGRLAGAIGAVLDLHRLQRDLDFLASAGNALVLLDPHDQVVASSSLLRLPRGTPARSVPLLHRALAAPADRVVDADPVLWWQRLALRGALPDGWQVLALGPRQFFGQAWLPALALLGLLLILLAVVVRLLLPRATWRLMRPVREMASALADFDPSSNSALPAPLLAAPYELRPIVDALEAHTALIQALLAQREETLAEREHEIELRTRELRRAVAALNESVRTDALTGLTNYRGWREIAESVWQEAREHGGEVGAIACDIDFFKGYNDTYGHPAGDACLRRVAAALQLALGAHVRVLARTGGEEFSALIAPATRAQLEQLAEAARAAVAALDIAHAASPRGHVTLSLGYSLMLVGPDARLDVLLRAADLALYRAKRNGRDQACELSVNALQKLRVEE